jgi:imidazolonepropionase-like amidohydrolase
MSLTLLRADGLIDGTGAPRIADAALLMDGDRIVAIGPRDRVPKPETARVVDLPGKTLLPGYVDTHQHVSNLGGKAGVRDPGAPRLPEREAALTLRGVRNLRIDLQHGITTGRVLGEPLMLDVVCKEAIDRGELAGPRLLIGGRALRPTFGHGFQGTIFDGVDAVRTAVRENLKAGAKQIKVFAGGGISDRESELNKAYYSLDELRAISDEAHRFGIPVTAHAKGGEAARLCVEAEFDSIEHGYTIDEPLLEYMISKNTWLSLTPLAVFHELGSAPAMRVDPISGPKYRYAREAHQRNLGRIVASGIRYTLGSDGRRGLYGHALEYLVEYGRSPLEAIRAGTLSGAELAGIADSVGSLEVGKIADVIAAPGDPSANIRAMQETELVAFGGRLAVEVLA